MSDGSRSPSSLPSRRARHPESCRATAVSMFSNCGAGDYGFRAAGFDFSVLAEIDSARLSVARLNHPGAIAIEGDVRETWPAIIDAFRKHHPKSRLDLLAACPPCQGMSSAQSQRGRVTDAIAGSRDARNLLVSVVGTVARALSPRAIVVENVQAFLSRRVLHPYSGKPTIAARLLVDELAESYAVFPIATDLCDFGVPQSRRRAFLTFLRRDEKAVKWLESQALTPYPLPSFSSQYGGSPKTLEAILEEEKLETLDSSVGRSASANDALHFVPVWRTRQYEMVSAIPPRSGGSAWENSKCRRCGTIARKRSRVRCSKCGNDLLRPTVKGEDGRLRIVSGFVNSSYRRMRPDRPAATVTTASGRIGSDNTIHPWENRVLSPRECCVLQTIPREFDWGDSLGIAGATHVRAMIGEAVPPLFTRLHGEVIKTLLASGQAQSLLSANDHRCAEARTKLGLNDQRKGPSKTQKGRRTSRVAV